MPLVETGGGKARILFGDQMIGRRCGVAQHHIGLPLEEQAIGLGPAGSDGDDIVRKPLPDRRRTLAIRGLHPHQQPKARGRGTRVLDHDGQIRCGERLEGGRHIGKVCAMHKGEITPVEGQELRVIPCDGQGQPLGRDAVGRKQPSLARGRRQIGIKAQHDIGIGRRAFEAQPRQKRRAIARAHELQVAGAGRLERRLDRGAGAPVGHEAVIGVDRQHRGLRERSPRKHRQSRSHDGVFHLSLLQCDGRSEGRVRRQPSLRRS